LSSYMLIIYVVAFIAIFYFMAIRPQQKQRRAHLELLNSLKKGDTIITAAGMYGTVKKVDDNVVEVEIAKGVTIKVNRRAVSEIIRDRAEAKAVAPAKSRGKNAPAEIEAADEAVDEPVDEVVDEAVDEPVDVDVYGSEETADEEERQQS
jgi:preprotein translocase subunit YajC